MAQYRKKPIVIEAVRFVNDGRELAEPEPAWYMAARTIERDEVGSIAFVKDRLEIRTLEGVMSATCGDWIIRGVKGEVYPCKPDIFAATYEPA